MHAWCGAPKRARPVTQFTAHAGPRAMLLATATEGPGGAPLELVEASPHDFFWGRGVDGSGCNHLGTLLMSVRQELLSQAPLAASVSQQEAPSRRDSSGQAGEVQEPLVQNTS